MAEIKLNDSFSSEVEAFRVAGEGLDIDPPSVSASNLSLPTVEAYQDRLFKIWQVVFRFGLLVKKDADDMDKLAAKLKAADAAGGSGDGRF